jgi:CheY-like chemotaxis protein
MPKTLLLADDSVTIQKVVGIVFATEDYRITAVDNGEDALRKARESRPDIVLADVVMPRMNGYELCQAMKADPQLADVPVLLLTGTFEPFDEARARAARADAHIAKPFESHALLTRVRELVEGIAAEPLPSPYPRAASPIAAPPPPAPPAPRVAPTAAPHRPAPPPFPVRPAARATVPPLPGTAARPGPLPIPSVKTPGIRPPQPAMPRPPVPGARPPPFPPAAPRAAGAPARPFGAASPRPTPPPPPARPLAEPFGFATAVAEDDWSDVAVGEGPARAAPPLASRERPPAANAPVAGDGGEAALRLAISQASREVIEKIAWEVVPQLAEVIIREHVERLVNERQKR